MIIIIMMMRRRRRRRRRRRMSHTERWSCFPKETSYVLIFWCLRFFLRFYLFPTNKLSGAIQ